VIYIFLRSENKDLLVVKINPHKFFRFFEKCKNAQMVVISVQVQPWPASINVLLRIFFPSNKVLKNVS